MRAGVGRQGSPVELLGKIQPSLRCAAKLVLGSGVAAREYRPQFVLGEFRRRDRCNVRLDHLADFFLQAEVCQKAFDEPVDIRRRKGLIRSALPWGRMYTLGGHDLGASERTD